jgi:hypothetical protein
VTFHHLSLPGSVRWLHLAAIQLAGRRFWLLPLLVLVWPVLQVLFFAMGWRRGAFEASAAQSYLIGAPLAVAAVFLGVRVIAGELERRTVELAYTVPAGRVWAGRLAAAWIILLITEVPLAVVTRVAFTPFPLSALYGALQAASFYLALSTALAALMRSQVTGAMASLALLALNGLFAAFLGRFSPFWNPFATEAAGSQLLAWSVQNRVGFLVGTAALVGLAFYRAADREAMLSG